MGAVLDGNVQLRQELSSNYYERIGVQGHSKYFPGLKWWRGGVGGGSTGRTRTAPTGPAGTCFRVESVKGLAFRVMLHGSWFMV